jgi:hypothetical protein
MTHKTWIHLCIDMQQMFAEGIPLGCSMDASPQVEEVARRQICGATSTKVGLDDP